jgi:hypothetical protein
MTLAWNGIFEALPPEITSFILSRSHAQSMSNDYRIEEAGASHQGFQGVASKELEISIYIRLPVGFNPLKLLAGGLNPRRARRLIEPIENGSNKPLIKTA